MKKSISTGFLYLLAGLGVYLPLRGLGASIELVTVPKSQAVQLTIYNSADITMVKESRELTFKPGLNTIQFSWAGTLIDPTSLRLTFLNNKDKLTLRDTSFPPAETTRCSGTSTASCRARRASKLTISPQASPGTPIIRPSPTRKKTP